MKSRGMSSLGGEMRALLVDPAFVAGVVMVVQVVSRSIAIKFARLVLSFSCR